MQKKDIELMRLRTQMAEMYRQAQPPYLPSQQKAAKDVLNKLQENYKILSGSYYEEFKIPTIEHINEGNINYAEMPLDALIITLQNLKKKVGAEAKIQVDGTLLCPADGNFVILSNKKQA